MPNSPAAVETPTPTPRNLLKEMDEQVTPEKTEDPHKVPVGAADAASAASKPKSSEQSHDTFDVASSEAGLKSEMNSVCSLNLIKYNFLSRLGFATLSRPSLHANLVVTRVPRISRSHRRVQVGDVGEDEDVDVGHGAKRRRMPRPPPRRPPVAMTDEATEREWYLWRGWSESDLRWWYGDGQEEQPERPKLKRMRVIGKSSIKLLEEAPTQSDMPMDYVDRKATGENESADGPGQHEPAEDDDEDKKDVEERETCFARRPPPTRQSAYVRWKATKEAFSHHIALFVDYPSKYQVPLPVKDFNKGCLCRQEGSAGQGAVPVL